MTPDRMIETRSQELFLHCHMDTNQTPSTEWKQWPTKFQDNMWNSSASFILNPTELAHTELIYCLRSNV